MDRTKPIQEGVRGQASGGADVGESCAMTPEQIREQNLFSQGFYPLPHPKHSEGASCSHFLIERDQRQEDAISRVSTSITISPIIFSGIPAGDLPQSAHDLGDVSQGKLVTIENYFDLV